ncbi:MAG TPA: ATP-binding protein [Polyangium sp.]|nr:ATP-binding protein [Polyangium sp.]
MRVYASSVEHLLAEIARIDLLLAVQALIERKSVAARASISIEEQVFALFDGSGASERSAVWQTARLEAERLAKRNEARARASLEAGQSLRLVKLAERFEINRLGLDLLLAALVPEIPDTASDNENHFTIGTILQALLATRGERLEALQYFSPTGPLVSHGLIQIEESKEPLLTRAVAVDPSVVGFLLGRDPIESIVAKDEALAATRIGALARRVHPHQRWDDLVLPADRMAILREICGHVRHRERVLDDWGFERKLGLRKGISALFSGPPGTGKTMSAGVIAHELGVPLLHVDLSTIVSKYVGETEKQLAQLFDAAQSTKAALFFDEADALFGKRTEVRDAHDRYANLETSYLLQRIEYYEGVVLCATNFMKNIDDAFVRRFAFIVEFPFPNAGDRLRIWQRMWTPETPLDTDIDLRLLAERIELSGGYIRNMALAAAFLAADEGKPVAMRHLLHAARREFQKMGKVVDAGIFESRR